jgi:two-component system, chemotaxis family, protein-glutamate methylesterase/glutaminase
MIGVVIGGSAGSLDALHALFSGLIIVTEATFTVVLHLSPSSKSLLTEVLGAYTDMPVREAVDKLPLTPGTVVVAPPDYHVLIERDLTVGLSRDPAVHYSRPAIDPLFLTAADVFGANAIGVLLSGANADGAVGLRSIQDRGGRVAVQDPASASAPEMPTAGLAACRPDLVATPRAIGLWLTSLLGGAA